MKHNILRRLSTKNKKRRRRTRRFSVALLFLAVVLLLFRSPSSSSAKKSGKWRTTTKKHRNEKRFLRRIPTRSCQPFFSLLSVFSSLSEEINIIILKNSSSFPLLTYYFNKEGFKSSTNRVFERRVRMNLF